MGLEREIGHDARDEERVFSVGLSLVPFQLSICANFLAALDHDPYSKAGCSNSAYQVGTALATLAYLIFFSQ